MRRKTIARYIMCPPLFMAVTVLTNCSKPLPVARPAAFALQQRDSLQNFINNYYENAGLPGLSVAIVKGDSTFCTAMGHADSSGKPFTPNTTFMAGSLSEPMLALAVLQLADEGKIDLDKPVVTYLPYFKMGGDSYQNVTVKHLLTHTSGIQHYSIMWDNPTFAPNAPETTTRSIASQQPDFKVPGSRVKRSPYNYDILADMICKVTGQTFEKYVQERVLNGIAMRHSSFIKPRDTAQPFVTSNWLSYRTRQDTLYPYNRENGGSGGLHTSATDMANWMFALLNRATVAPSAQLTDKLLANAITLQFNTGKGGGIGFGWDIEQIDHDQVFVKSSKYGGFCTTTILIPGKKIGVTVASNIAEAGMDPLALSRPLAQWLMGKPLVQPKVPVSILMGKTLAGTGNMADAFAAYRSAQQRANSQFDVSPAALSQFGINLLHRVHDRQKALEAFKFCVERFPRSAYAHLNLAEGFIFNKDAPNTRKALAMANSLPDDSGLKARYMAYLKENLEILEEKKS